MDDKIRIGVIGCSDVAKRIVIPSIISSSNSCLSMLCSRSRDKARMWAKEYGCDKYGTYEEVINDENIDAVYISLPPSLHAEWSIKAACSGKHIICEKPAATSFEQAKKMIDAARKNKIRILEAFMFRFHPQHKKFKELIDSDMTGKISVFEGKFGLVRTDLSGFRFDKNLGGGSLNDTGCYPVCASRMVLGAEPKAVSSHLVLDDKNGVDIQGSFYFTYSDGKSAFGSFSYVNSYQSTYSVWGSKAMAGLKRAYAIKPNTNSVIWINSDKVYSEIVIPWVDQSKVMVDEFCRVVKKETRASFDYENDLLNQARAMEAIRLSHSERRLVRLDEIKF